MNILVINGHPDEEGYGTAIFKRYLGGIDTQKHTVESIDLATADFDPVLRFGYRKHMEEDAFIQNSQRLLLWADHLVFIYPIWWSALPSVLKGWIDRVFTPRVAYSSNQKGSFLWNYLTGRQFVKRLKGKTADIITTAMAPSWWYRLFSGPISVPDSYGIAVLKNAVLGHCGVKTKRIMTLGDMGRGANTTEKRAAFLQRVVRRARQV